MSRPNRVTPAPAIIVAAVVVLSGCTSQSPSFEPATTSSSEATPAESAAASSGPVSFEDIPAGTDLEPGTYVLHYASIGGAETFPTLAITFTVPAGWARVRVDGLVWNDSGTRLGFLVADNLYADPCDPGQGLMDPPVGPSVDDLSRALVALPGWEDAVVTEDSFYGFGGQSVELAIPADQAPCAGEDSRLLHTLGSPGYTLAPDGGERLELRILNVAGTRLIVIATNLPEASAQDRADLQAVVDSIQIVP
jgi:hypothetical protein